MSETGQPASVPAWVADAAPAAPVADELVRLLDHYEQALFGFVSTLLADRDSARDCVQDTFLRAYRHLLHGKPVTVQWLYRVARNRAIDELRHRGRERVGGAPAGEAVLEDFDAWERTAAVRAALLRLSPEDREVLYLAEVDGFTSVEIGAMLDLRPGTVRMRLMRAHERFRRAYGDGP